MCNSPAPSAHVENALNYTTASSYAFIWWCFVRHMKGLTLLKFVLYSEEKTEDRLLESREMWMSSGPRRDEMQKFTYCGDP